MLFRITITLQSGKHYAGIGYFADQDEAIEQTWADYPEACTISAICLRGARS